MSKYRTEISIHKELLQIVNKVKPDNVVLTRSFFAEKMTQYSGEVRYESPDTEIIRLSESYESGYGTCYFLHGLLVKFEVTCSWKDVVLNLDNYDCEEVTIIIDDLPNFELINTKGAKTNLICVSGGIGGIKGVFDKLVKVGSPLKFKVKARETKHALIPYIDENYLESITKFDITEYEEKYRDKIIDVLVTDMYTTEIHNRILELPNIESVEIELFSECNGYIRNINDPKLKSVKVKKCVSSSDTLYFTRISLKKLPAADKYIIDNYRNRSKIIVNTELKSLEIPKTLDSVRRIKEIEFEQFPTEEIVIENNHFEFIEKSLKTKSARSIYRK